MGESAFRCQLTFVANAPLPPLSHPPHPCQLQFPPLHLMVVTTTPQRSSRRAVARQRVAQPRPVKLPQRWSWLPPAHRSKPRPHCAVPRLHSRTGQCLCILRHDKRCRACRGVDQQRPPVALEGRVRSWPSPETRQTGSPPPGWWRARRRHQRRTASGGAKRLHCETRAAG